jgi:hypothetical protein
MQLRRPNESQHIHVLVRLSLLSPYVPYPAVTFLVSLIFISLLTLPYDLTIRPSRYVKGKLTVTQKNMSLKLLTALEMYLNLQTLLKKSPKLLALFKFSLKLQP